MQHYKPVMFIFLICEKVDGMAAVCDRQRVKEHISFLKDRQFSINGSLTFVFIIQLHLTFNQLSLNFPSISTQLSLYFSSTFTELFLNFPSNFTHFRLTFTQHSFNFSQLSLTFHSISHQFNPSFRTAFTKSCGLVGAG